MTDLGAEGNDFEACSDCSKHFCTNNIKVIIKNCLSETDGVKTSTSHFTMGISDEQNCSNNFELFETVYYHLFVLLNSESS